MKKSMFAMFLVAAVSAAAQWDAGAPRINGPKVYGATPGRAFLYAFPTCGSRIGGGNPDGFAIVGKWR